MTNTQKTNKRLDDLERNVASHEEQIGVVLDRLNHAVDILNSAGCSVGELQEEIAAWSMKAFGDKSDRPYTGPLEHLKQKEIAEVVRSGGRDPIEWADCLMLLLDAMARADTKIEDVVDYAFAKLNVCKRRQYGPLNEDGFSEHIRKGES